MGGIERAGTTSVVRSGATCRVGMGDGIGARLRRAAGTAFEGCVARAGVDVRARRTGVRLRAGLVDFVVTRTPLLTSLLGLALLFFVVPARALLVLALLGAVLALFLLDLLFTTRFAAERAVAPRTAAFVAFLRVVERTAPVVFLLDTAAFNCFPLFGLWPRPSSRTPRNFPGPPYSKRF